MNPMDAIITDLDAVVEAAEEALEVECSMHFAIAAALDCMADQLHAAEPTDEGWIATRLWLRFNADVLRKAGNIP